MIARWIVVTVVSSDGTALRWRGFLVGFPSELRRSYGSQAAWPGSSSLSCAHAWIRSDGCTPRKRMTGAGLASRRRVRQTAPRALRCWFPHRRVQPRRRVPSRDQGVATKDGSGSGSGRISASFGSAVFGFGSWFTPTDLRVRIPEIPRFWGGSLN